MQEHRRRDVPLSRRRSRRRRRGGCRRRAPPPTRSPRGSPTCRRSSVVAHVMWPERFSCHPSRARIRSAHASSCGGVSSWPIPGPGRGLRMVIDATPARLGVDGASWSVPVTSARGSSHELPAARAGARAGAPPRPAATSTRRGCLRRPPRSRFARARVRGARALVPRSRRRRGPGRARDERDRGGRAPPASSASSRSRTSRSWASRPACTAITVRSNAGWPLRRLRRPFCSRRSSRP